jgi:hypothetical protein
MTERASLKRPDTLVNRVPAIMALFLAASCVQDSTKDQSVTIRNVTAPIIWQTPTFDGPIRGFSLSADGAPWILVSFEQTGLKVLDIDGADVSPKHGPFFPDSLSDGVVANFDGAPLRLFFGAEKTSDTIAIFAFADGLESPTRISLEPAITGSVQGVCVDDIKAEGSIAKLGYWTQLDNTTLVVGEVRNTQDNKLTFIETDRVRHDKYLTSCALDADMVVTGGGFGLQFRSGGDDPQMFDIPGVPVELAYIDQSGGGIAAMTFSGGQVYTANTKGILGAVTFRPGISSNTPSSLGSLSFSGQNNVGGLSDGYLAVESKSARGTQIVYADLKALTEQLSD